MPLLTLQDKRNKRLLKFFNSFCDAGMRPEKALKKARLRLEESNDHSGTKSRHEKRTD